MCENSIALSISKASGTLVTPTLDRLYQVGKVAFNLLTRKNGRSPLLGLKRDQPSQPAPK